MPILSKYVTVSTRCKLERLQCHGRYLDTRSWLRIFSLLGFLNVDPRQSERVADGNIPSGGVPEVTDGASNDAKLSQEDMDNFFG